MAAPKTTVWDIEPHTQAKHAILRRYLQAWTRILVAGGFPEVMYVDGFAGPGHYSQGEDGSPLIALRVALELNARTRIRATIRFLFIEKNRERTQTLEKILGNMDMPSNFQVQVAGGETYETAILKLLDSYDNEGKQPPPIFAFMDPFGWAGMPFSIVQKILGYQNCEVFITFMYEEINRFIEHPDQKENFNSFFGTRDWQEIREISDHRKHNQFLHDLYLQQLRNKAGAQHVRSFQMRNKKNTIDYYLFYATNSIVGLRKMKEAMWKVDETGEFHFSDATDPDQLILFGKEPRYDVLCKQILDYFDGKEATVREIEEFVLTETSFRETHYKRILRSLETSDKIEAVNPLPGRRAGTYANDSLVLRFFASSYSGLLL